MLLKPLYQTDEVEAQVVTWRGDGSFFDRFQADGAGLGLDMAAPALAGSAFDAEVVWWCRGGCVQPIVVPVVHPLLAHVVWSVCGNVYERRCKLIVAFWVSFAKTSLGKSERDLNLKHLCFTSRQTQLQ